MHPRNCDSCGTTNGHERTRMETSQRSRSQRSAALWAAARRQPSGCRSHSGGLDCKRSAATGTVALHQFVHGSTIFTDGVTNRGAGWRLVIPLVSIRVHSWLNPHSLFAAHFEHQTRLELMQTRLQADRILVRIDQPLDARMEHLQLLALALLSFTESG